VEATKADIVAMRKRGDVPGLINVLIHGTTEPGSRSACAGPTGRRTRRGTLIASLEAARPPEVRCAAAALGYGEAEAVRR